jgi:hypothetical protein
MKSVTAPPRMKSNMREPLETVAGGDVEDGHREGADTDGDHEKVEHGWYRSESEMPPL